MELNKPPGVNFCLCQYGQRGDEVVDRHKWDIANILQFMSVSDKGTGTNKFDRLKLLH